jgi:hypothetical protein
VHNTNANRDKHLTEAGEYPDREYTGAGRHSCATVPVVLYETATYENGWGQYNKLQYEIAQYMLIGIVVRIMRGYMYGNHDVTYDSM